MAEHQYAGQQGGGGGSRHRHGDRGHHGGDRERGDRERGGGGDRGERSGGGGGGGGGRHDSGRREEWEYESVPKGLVDEVPTYMLPDEVKKYIIWFEKKFTAGNPSEIEVAYESAHKKLTEKYFPDQPWPTADVIAPLVSNKVFLLFYKELYFRHVYAKMQITIEHRLESFANYQSLFKYFLESGTTMTPGKKDRELPDRWLWEMIDEFIYQFQSFVQYRCKLHSRSGEEVALLQEKPLVWNVVVVLNTLQLLIDNSRINQLLAGADGGLPNPAPNFQMLGFFSLVGLLRIHTLFADFHLALKTLDLVELSKRSPYSRVPACQISLFYYMGVSYLMMRRYQDAVRVFSNILVYLVRTQHIQARLNTGYDNLAKRREQLFHLLAVAVTLSPHRVDEAVHTQLMEKCGDKIQRMRGGDELAMEELFSFGCPKFLSPALPSLDGGAHGSVLDPFRYQVRLFMEDAGSHLKLAASRSYLKLYSTLPLAKLASFLDMPPENLRVLLHSYKHKFSQLVWSSGPPLSGTRTPIDDTDFFLDGDMIHIADVKIARCFGEYFIHQISKLSAQ